MTNTELRELIDRMEADVRGALLINPNSVRAYLRIDDAQSLATALQSYAARVEELEGALREADYQLNGLAEAMRKTGHFDTCADAVQTLLSKIRAALLKQLPGDES